ncbi:MAG TPA: hypothetical protein VIE43_08635 [Thermoanaerobaculia bacterium]|jgi:ferric-dicitrate binding protein FerR (iron transport regulator)|nr:hypothetical protein [Thermoanaerobaculia bacterium]
MATEEWLTVARSYAQMSEPARAEYWGRLTPDQQNALREALAVTGPAAAAANAPVARPAASPAPAKSGCGGPIAAGCVGVILGIILTVAAEVAIVMMGFQSVDGMIKKYNHGVGISDPGDPGATDCTNPRYRAAHPQQCDPAQTSDGH